MANLVIFLVMGLYAIQVMSKPIRQYTSPRVSHVHSSHHENACTTYYVSNKFMRTGNHCIFVSKFYFQSTIGQPQVYETDLAAVLTKLADKSPEEKGKAFRNYMSAQMEICYEDAADAVSDIDDDSVEDKKSKELEDVSDEYDDLELDPDISQALTNNNATEAIRMATSVINVYCAKVFSISAIGPGSPRGGGGGSGAGGGKTRK